MSVDKATVSQWIAGDMQFGFTTEQGDWVMVKSLYEFTGIFIMHCMPFFRITVFTGIYILKSELKMMICVLRNILLIIYTWWACKTCWYQLVHTVILSSLMGIIVVPSQIVVRGPRDITLLSTDKCKPFNRMYRATVTGSQYNTLWSNSYSEQN